jgi:predicted DNA-binding transcriptional regulator YafY
LGYVQKTQDLEIFSPRILAKHSSFSPLAEAISDGFQVSFEYQKPGSDSASRQLTPLKLRFLEGQWVLLAAESDEVKNFLLRRITTKVIILSQAAQRISADAVAVAEKSLVDFVASQQVTLELESDSEAWWHFGAPGDHRVTFNFMDKELLVEDLLELASGLRVLEPVEVREMLSKKLETVAVQHA